MNSKIPKITDADEKKLNQPSSRIPLNRKLLETSKPEYHIRLLTREWVEEPLLQIKNHSTLYSLEDRIRIHIILRQILRTYSEKVIYPV